MKIWLKIAEAHVILFKTFQRNAVHISFNISVQSIILGW